MTFRKLTLIVAALAIAFTDTGELGKLFSEALENIDEKQEGGRKSEK